MQNRWTKNAIWNLKNKKWPKWRKSVSPFLFNNTYGLRVLTMDTKCPKQVFMFDWSIYRLFVLNRGKKYDALQIMIFVNIWSTWVIFEVKTRSETWITRNESNGVSLFQFSYLIKLMATLFSQWTPKVQIKYFMFD
jgi:hypothetical protein